MSKSGFTHGNATSRGCLGSCEQFAGGKCCIQHDSRDGPDWGKKEMKKRQTCGQKLVRWSRILNRERAILQKLSVFITQN